MKILIKQLGRIGDMICLTAIFPLLKSQNPTLEIDVLCSRHNHKVLEYNPHIKNVIIYKKSISALIRLIIFFRKKIYDFYFDPKDHYSKESIMLSKIIKSYVKVGFNANKKAFDIAIDSAENNTELHYIERALKAFKILGLELNSEKMPLPELYPNISSKKIVDDFIESKLFNNSFIFLNISATSESRKWSESNWIEFIEGIKSHKFKIILSSVREDYDMAQKISSNFENVTQYQAHSLDEIFYLVEKSKYVITVDTSIVHIASAYDKPIFALYPSIKSNFIKFAPLSKYKKIVFADEGSLSINTIKPSTALEYFEQFLEELV